MALYRLTDEAVEHTEGVYDFTIDRFGEYQADAYVAGLKHTFELLVDFPRMGAAAFELAPELRRYRYQAHHIFCAPTPDFVLIRAVLHTKREIHRDLFDL